MARRRKSGPPREPTEEMINAFVSVKPSGNPQDADRIWMAMWDAWSESTTPPADPAQGRQGEEAP